jgi:hypothetical protein
MYEIKGKSQKLVLRPDAIPTIVTQKFAQVSGD